MLRNSGMNLDLKKALAAPTVDSEILRATLHAEFQIRKYWWNGFKPLSDKVTKDLVIAGMGAGDFVHLAIQRFIEGVRAYDGTRSLLENLNSAVDSIIWSAKKQNKLDPMLDYLIEYDDNGRAVDPISTSEDESPSSIDSIINEEIAQDQQQHFKNFYNSFDGNKDVQDYLEALSEGVFKPQDIAECTGMDVTRVYEIRKMLKKYAPDFFGVQNSSELERKISEGI